MAKKLWDVVNEKHKFTDSKSSVNDFFAMTLKVWFIKEKFGKLDFIKIKIFALWKLSLRKWKDMSQSGRKYLQTISTKGLACRIRELLKLGNIKTKNSVEKWTKDLNRNFTNKYTNGKKTQVKRCSWSAVTGEIKQDVSTYLSEG